MDAGIDSLDTTTCQFLNATHHKGNIPYLIFPADTKMSIYMELCLVTSNSYRITNSSAPCLSLRIFSSFTAYPVSYQNREKAG